MYLLKDVTHANISTVYSNGAKMLFMRLCRAKARGSGFPVSQSGVFFPDLTIGVF